MNITKFYLNYIDTLLGKELIIFSSKPLKPSQARVSSQEKKKCPMSVSPYEKPIRSKYS